MRRLFCLCLFFVYCHYSYTQSIPDTRSVVIQENSGISRAEVFIYKTDIIYKEDMHYYFYYKNKISTVQGGHSGYLLQGKYESFYPGDALREQGSFEKGLKHGIWKYWYTNGVLKQKENWHFGKKKGDFEEYDKEGNLIKKGEYKNNELNGKLMIYQADTLLSQQKYKKGMLTEKKKKRKKKEKKSKKQDHEGNEN